MFNKVFLINYYRDIINCSYKWVCLATFISALTKKHNFSLQCAFSNKIRNIIEMSITISNLPTLHIFVSELRLNCPPPITTVKAFALPILSNCTTHRGMFHYNSTTTSWYVSYNCTTHCGMCHIIAQHIVDCVI